MPDATLERLANILKRELDAQDVVIASIDQISPNHTALTWDLGRGRTLVVLFATPPSDLQEKRERLAALVDSFAHLFAEIAGEPQRNRPEPNATLQSELNVLAGRTHASCALVIDAKSPIIWGASMAPTNAEHIPLDPRVHAAFTQADEIGLAWRDFLARPNTSRPIGERKESKSNAESARTLRLVPPIDELAGLDAHEREIIAFHADLARSAIASVRAHPTLALLHRGEHLHETVRNESFGYVARSFATIYVLILVFPGPFDELGAERAATRALPIIERLVIALPPDDSPGTQSGAVVALRPRRRR